MLDLGGGGAGPVTNHTPYQLPPDYVPGKPPQSYYDYQNSQQTPPNPYNFGGGDYLNAFYNQLQNQYKSQAGFNQQQIDLQSALNNYRGGYFNQQDTLANQTYQNALDRLGLQGQNIGVQQGQEQRNVNAYNDIIANMSKLFDINRQTLQAQTGQINLQNLQDVQKANSAATAGGFGFAPGVQTGIAQINQGSDYAKTLAQLGAAKQDISTQDTILRDRMRQDVSATNLQQLNIQAQQLGVDAKDLYINLQKSLAQTGLDRFTDVNGLMKMIASKDASQAALGQQLVGQLTQQAGLLVQGGYLDSSSLQGLLAQYGGSLG